MYIIDKLQATNIKPIFTSLLVIKNPSYKKSVTCSVHFVLFTFMLKTSFEFLLNGLQNTDINTTKVKKKGFFCFLETITKK